MRSFTLLGMSIVCILSAACNVNAPVDPANLVNPIDSFLDNVGNTVENLLNDPLSSKPFPVLVGGDNEKVYYATNLGDSRINFPGSTTDLVIPGFVGPSNLYQFASKKRELIRPLIPGGSFLGLATDGQRVAYIGISDLAEGTERIIVADVNSLDANVIYDSMSDESAGIISTTLALDDGRLAFLLLDINNQSQRLRVEDLAGIEPTIEIEADAIGAFQVRGNRLAYVAQSADGAVDLMLRDLHTDETTTVASGIRVDYVWDITLTMADNHIVWSELTFENSNRVMAYDITEDKTAVWADPIIGTLAGANDEHFVTEEFVERFPDAADQYKVRRYDLDGKVRVLAEFRADGLAGQTTVIGDRAAWVNPEREVVLTPLAGGDRTIFAPF